MISRIVALLVVGLISVSVGCSPAMPWSKPRATAQFYFVDAGNGKPMPFKGVIILSEEDVKFEQERLQIVRPVDCLDGPTFKLTVIEQLQQLGEHFHIESVTVQTNGISPAITAIVTDSILELETDVVTSTKDSMLTETYFQELTKWETPTAEVDSGFVPETLLPDAS